MDLIQISEAEARVLGCLLEKESTTPDAYPLTLNSLTLACNQKSNREPVTDYDQHFVLSAVDALRGKGLAMMIGQGGAKVPKYCHRLTDVYSMESSSMALLTVLLLRGPQTAGELKQRTERLYQFGRVEDVEAELFAMCDEADGRPAMVKKLARGAGMREARYVHLLCGEPAQDSEEAAMPVEKARTAFEELSSKVQSMLETIETQQARIDKLEQALSAQQEVIEKLRDLL